jgi:hypothetical protein
VTSCDTETGPKRLPVNRKTHLPVEYLDHIIRQRQVRRRRSHASATLWVAIGAGQVGDSLTRQTSVQMGSVAGYAEMGYAARDLAR